MNTQIDNENQKAELILVQPVQTQLVLQKNTHSSSPTPLGSPLKLKSSKDDSSSNNYIDCPFKQHGCHKNGEKGEVKRHVRDDRNLHLLLLCQSLNPIRNSSMRQQSNYIEKYLQTIRTMDISDGIYEKYGCQFTFHLPNIGLSVVKASKKKSYRTIISQPFFTHGYGYKMAAVAAPYGDGPALREYFSIFVSLLKSEHDAILEWPFRCPVTFTLLTDKKTAIISQTYNPDEHPEASESFQRPIGLRNGAFGIQNFCPLEKIDSCSLSNDFFIQIKIHLKKNLIYQAKEIDSSQCQNQQPFETDFEQKSEEI